MKAIVKLTGNVVKIKGIKMMDTGIHLICLADDGIEYLYDKKEIFFKIKKTFKNGKITIILDYQHFGSGIKSQKKCLFKAVVQ